MLLNLLIIVDYTNDDFLFCFFSIRKSLITVLPGRAEFRSETELVFYAESIPQPFSALHSIPWPNFVVVVEQDFVINSRI
jgi:hypothetical protein